MIRNELNDVRNDIMKRTKTKQIERRLTNNIDDVNLKRMRTAAI